MPPGCCPRTASGARNFSQTPSPRRSSRQRAWGERSSSLVRWPPASLPMEALTSGPCRPAFAGFSNARALPPGRVERQVSPAQQELRGHREPPAQADLAQRASTISNKPPRHRARTPSLTSRGYAWKADAKTSARAPSWTSRSRRLMPSPVPRPSASTAAPGHPVALKQTPRTCRSACRRERPTSAAHPRHRANTPASLPTSSWSLLTRRWTSRSCWCWTEPRAPARSTA